MGHCVKKREKGKKAKVIFAGAGIGPNAEKLLMRETCSISSLQGICLQSLKQVPGFEMVHEILIQPRESLEGGANWTVAAVRPRVGNQVLRDARDTIQMLQTNYELTPEDASARTNRRRA